MFIHEKSIGLETEDLSVTEKTGLVSDRQLSGHGVSFSSCGNRNVLELDRGDSYTAS